MAFMVVALVLFLAMVIAWVVLPGSVMALPIEETTDTLMASPASQTV